MYLYHYARVLACLQIKFLDKNLVVKRSILLQFRYILCNFATLPSRGFGSVCTPTAIYESACFHSLTNIVVKLLNFCQSHEQKIEFQYGFNLSVIADHLFPCLENHLCFLCSEQSVPCLARFLQLLVSLICRSSLFKRLAFYNGNRRCQQTRSLTSVLLLCPYVYVLACFVHACFYTYLLVLPCQICRFLCSHFNDLLFFYGFQAAL